MFLGSCSLESKYQNQAVSTSNVSPQQMSDHPPLIELFGIAFFEVCGSYVQVFHLFRTMLTGVRHHGVPHGIRIFASQCSAFERPLPCCTSLACSLFVYGSDERVNMMDIVVLQTKWRYRLDGRKDAARSCQIRASC